MSTRTTPTPTSPGHKVPTLSTLQAKVLLILGGVYLLLVLLSTLVHHFLLQPSFDQLEREAALKDLERVRSALTREVDFLQTTAADWAVWTDTWEYMRDGGAEYERANLTADALAALHVDGLYLFDVQGRLRWGGEFDPGSGLVKPKGGLAQALGPGHPLRSGDDPERTVGGLLSASGGVWLVGAHAITDNSGQAVPAGTVVFSRRLDDAARERLARQAGVPLAALPARPDPFPGQGDVRFQASPGLNHVHLSLRDVSGQPVQWLRMDLPREISARGRRVILVARAMLMLSGVLTVSLTILLLRRVVLNPVRRLTDHAVALAAGASSAGFPADRRDELGVLARELDTMMGQLAETRRRLLDQSYASGRAAMAAGILHNIGNSVTPLAAQVGSLRDELAQAPLEDLELALAELRTPGLPDDRRHDLQAFAGLAAGELRQGLERARSIVGELGRQTGHISRILSAQERERHAEAPLEATPLDQLALESLALLAEEARGRLRPAGLEDLARLGAPELPRLTLQQVLVNLLLNAAEATAEAGKPVGQALFRARSADGTLSLSLSDEGCGFSPDTAERLFERGFTTKNKGRPAGLGLHWCSNTLQMLGGRLWAESAGPGRGATFHLELPLPTTVGMRAEDLG